MRVMELTGLANSNGKSARRRAPAVDADGGLPLESLDGGKIAAISANACVARLADGEVRAFGRYCPHQGADLALGFVENDKIMCPWHNLPLDPTSGDNPCNALAKLKTFDCEVRDERVYVSEAKAKESA